MHTFPRLFMISLLAAGTSAYAQKPAQIQITAMLSRIPIPGSSAACYEACTKTTGADGTISIKDHGPQFTDLTDALNRVMKREMDAAASNPGGITAPAAPSAEQIEQMKAQAMQQAAQYSQNGGTAPRPGQQGNYSKPPSVNVALMQELGRAQSAMLQVRTLEIELSNKMAALPPAATVKPGPNCPEVQQGGYAGPTCACTKQRNVDYETRSVTAMDAHLQQVADLLRHYIPLLKDQIALVDQAEADNKYGEGVTDPTTLQMLHALQQQALGTVPMVLGMSENAWGDGANQFLDLVNAKNQTCK